MNHQHRLPVPSLKIVTAAVLLALGSNAPALAQQQQDRQARDEWPQQTQEQGTSEHDRQQDRDTTAANRDADATSSDRSEGRLEEVTQQHDGLGKFVEAVKAAGMEDSLLQGTYTVFAPTDEAIEQLGDDEFISSENWEQVAELLRAHIVADDLDREKAGNTPRVMTLDGGMINLDERDGQLTVDGATVEDRDIQVAGLRIFPIDQVLSGADPAPSRPDSDRAEHTQDDEDRFSDT